MYDLWSLLFANFRQEVPVDAGRTWLYEAIHFPLHFSMLLLLLGMVNTVALNSFAFGMVDMTNKFLTALQYAETNVSLSSAPVQRLAVEMNRLDTTPDFEAEYALMQGMANGSITSDVALEAWTYFAQLVYAACEKSSIVVGGDADTLLTQLYQIDQNATAPGFDVQEMRVRAEGLGFAALTSIVRTALTGTLWLYPAAGITLILCALRSMTRYHFKGATHWIVHGLQLGFGAALALLGLLDIGSGAVDVDWDDEMRVHRPVYTVVLNNMGLAVVFVTYTCVVLGSSVSGGVTALTSVVDRGDRAQGRVEGVADEGVREEAEGAGGGGGGGFVVLYLGLLRCSAVCIRVSKLVRHGRCRARTRHPVSSSPPCSLKSVVPPLARRIVAAAPIMA